MFNYFKNKLLFIVTIFLVSATIIITNDFTTEAIGVFNKYPIPSLPNNSTVGLNLAYSMNLLSQSNPQNKNTVRILFYGQSITRDYWWRPVVNDLNNRFPNAEIISKNLAIGGFAAKRLILNVERDILDFYPDLIIFHVYGSHQKYEKIIQKMRTLTTADILIQTDHLGGKIDPNKPDEGWQAFMNEYFLKRMAAKYHCELADIRSFWRQYLLDYNYQPNKLLRDGLHLNNHGNFLMAELVKSYLQPNPEAKNLWLDRVKTYEVNKDIVWKDGKLSLEFVGNRIDAIASLFGDTPAEILIDGKHPSDIPNLYLFTRANYTPKIDWPWEVNAPFRISWQTPLVAEDWQITILEVDSSSQPINFTFELTGSVTGFDGIGSNSETFVSNSGRVVIEPQHWWLKTDPLQQKPSPIQPGYQLNFTSQLMGVDTYLKPEFRGFTRESTVTLAKGLENKTHTLTIIPLGKGKVPIKAIRVYKPPLTSSQLELEEIDPNTWLENR